MPLYYFDTDDGHKTFRDEVGTELPDDQEARNEGSRAMGELAREFIPGGDPQKNITMWVRNEKGEAVVQLSMSFAIKALV